MKLRPDDWPAPTLSLAAGLALVEAIDAAAPGQPLMLKWPNDVMLSGKKLAGILLERSGERVAVGFGVNLATAPELSGRSSAALEGGITPEAFAPLIAASVSRLIGLWRETGSVMLGQAWLARSHPIGTRLKVHSTAEDQAEGRFDGIEPDGALRLRLDDGAIDIIRAGDVEL